MRKKRHKKTNQTMTMSNEKNKNKPLLEISKMSKQTEAQERTQKVAARKIL
jgi:hypothetical protein